jgi:hypothetical protein
MVNRSTRNPKTAKNVATGHRVGTNLSGIFSDRIEPADDQPLNPEPQTSDGISTASNRANG